MNQRTEAVDIIIPVYNGYEDLQLCIPSVKKHTDLTRHRIILINDCSPDERIAPYLDRLAGENILVLHNEKNLGFSGNVNKGICISGDRDVILLNSDTVVTAGWVDKIRACAYREESIGTVTPLSNSATLCSVPVMCQDNQVPEHVTIDEYAALIERCSLHRYPEITVAVGFCMFIKRRVIEDVGLFDAETFGRGYGEENDFCNRALQMGYHHVMCDDTFIYHKGTASFDTEEKQALLQEHTAILEQRYPEQMKRNHLYCMENPDQEIRDNINMYTQLHNGKKNLLYLIHLDFRERAMSNIGGTQIHVKELMEEFRDEYNVFVAARDGEYLRVTAYTDLGEVPLKFEIGKAPDFPVFRSAHLRRIFDQVLMAFSIDLVHVHHTQDLSLEIYEAARALDIPVIATLHDYYYACPTILLLDGENHFCTSADAQMTEEERETRCRECLWKKRQIVPQGDYLRIWRRENGRALALCWELIFPSKSARDIFLSYYPALADKCRVIYHGEDKLEYQVVHVKAPENARKNPALTVKLDHIAKSSQGLNDIKGWAYLEGIDNEETEIYVELTDGGGGTDCFLVTKAARPDIVDAFGDPLALMCGIDLRVSSERLADGPVKIQVYVKHGNETYTTGRTFKGEYRRRFGASERLNVAFLGGMVQQKGSGLARAMIAMDRTDINWFVFGEIGDPGMMEIRQDNCFFSGKYRKGELPQLLADNAIDVVCILPIWPETFCYTVSEAWMNGVPVLGTDMGAVGERIRSTGGGWLVSPEDTPRQILDRLHFIKNHPQEYQKKRMLVEQMPLKSVAEMCGEYRELYKGLMEPEGESGSDPRADFGREEGGSSSGGTQGEKEIDFDFIFQGLALANPSINGRGKAAQLNRLKNENAALRAYAEVIQSTTSYRLARRIADANIPFKELLKKMLKRRR